jgi:hypothetical protein
VNSVFSELDPSLDLPEEERPYAGLHGKKFKHSGSLRRGLAETLRLVAVLHKELDLTNTNCRPEQFVENLIAELPGLATDYREIASLHGELPPLMEAAPRPLLAALGQMLEGDGATIAPIFQDKDPFFSHSPHTGLLWALEALAWDPKYISEATLTLAKLARVDPGGKLMNRPINSLRDVLLPWRPQTNATLGQRLAALDQITAKEPNVSWKVITKLFPGGHDVVSPSAMPRYREAGASEREVLTYGLVGQAYREVVERAFRLAGEDPERWVVIIKGLSGFEPSQRQRTVELVEALASRLSADQKSVIWVALRDEVARHKAFPAAQWAMKEPDLEPLQTLASNLEPSDPLTRILWLFNEYHPHIPQRQEEPPILDLVERTRETAALDLFRTSGREGILRLAHTVALPAAVAVAVGSVIDNIEEFAALTEAAMNETSKLPIFACVLSARAEQKFGTLWRSQISDWNSLNRWTPEQLADLLLAWGDERVTWDFAASLGPEIAQSYWKRKRSWALRGEANVEMAVEKYLDVGRAIGAMQAIQFVADRVSAQIIFRILDAAVDELNASEIQPTSEFMFELDQLFDSLQRRPELAMIEIAKREYAYLPLFSYRDRQLTLHRVMAEDPAFYVSLLCDAFRPKTGEVPEPTEGQRAKANAAYRLLSEFRAVPGMNGADIDVTPLRHWVAEVRRLAREADRSVIGDEFVGHLIAHAPPDADGAWPHRVVRDLIEVMASNEAELGIEVERFNMRGVQTRAMYEGGGRERGTAQQSREWAKATRAWPRTTAMLERIAQSWEEYAQREDERAKQDEMRFE